jgi:tRNA-dihydrouridine synthase 2
MEMDYEDKLILAPMVRVGTLPFRLLAAECGADITYSEELVALKLMKAVRVVNDAKRTIDFVAPDKSIVYQTCQDDKNNIAQLGAANAATALAAATVISKDIAGIDLNCGCPKHFSVQGGMGSALLKTPEVIEDILSTLSRNLENPVTVKIRLLEKDADTVEIIRRAERAGVKAVAIHARFVHERPRDRAHWDRLATVIEMAGSAAGIPLIINGDIHNPEDIIKAQQLKGVSSVMVARGAINDVSIFNKAKVLMHKETDETTETSEKREEAVKKPFSNSRIFDNRNDACKRYTEYALKTNNNLPNTKYVLKTMLEVPGGFNGPTLAPDHSVWNHITACKSTQDLCKIWDIDHASLPPLPDIEPIYDPGR